MGKKQVLNTVDHTLLGQNATWSDIQQILDDAINYEAAFACIPASYVAQAAEYVDGKFHEDCNGKILKVIIETCLLTEEEKIRMCEKVVL